MYYISFYGADGNAIKQAEPQPRKSRQSTIKLVGHVYHHTQGLQTAAVAVTCT